MRATISELENRLDEPTARGLATAVSRAIRDGTIAVGDRLPPIRELAVQLTMSPTTVSSAWAMLARAGIIRTDGRRGTVVADTAGPREGRYQQALDPHTVFDVDLSTGVPDAALLPQIGPALRSVTTAGTPQSYLDNPVLQALHEALLASWPYDAPALTVVDGAMDALDLVIRTRLRFGDRVVVEQPTFAPLLDLLEASGIEVSGVPMDEWGIEPDALAEALDTPAQAVFLQPRSQNPTGISWTTQRVDELAAVLRDADVLVVEDDSAYAISTSPDLSVGSALPHSTVHIRSFSKSYGPDLRLAALSGPDEVIAGIRRLRQLGQGWSSRLLQRVLVALLSDPATTSEVMAAREEYSRRRGDFVAALAAHGIQVPGTDGLNVWVPVRDESAALMRMAARGIGVASGTPFMVGADEHQYIRVTVGLLSHDHAALADEVAAAAGASGRREGAR